MVGRTRGAATRARGRKTQAQDDMEWAPSPPQSPASAQSVSTQPPIVPAQATVPSTQPAPTQPQLQPAQALVPQPGAGPSQALVPTTQPQPGQASAPATQQPGAVSQAQQAHSRPDMFPHESWTKATGDHSHQTNITNLNMFCGSRPQWWLDDGQDRSENQWVKNVRDKATNERWAEVKQTWDKLDPAVRAQIPEGLSALLSQPLSLPAAAAEKGNTAAPKAPAQGTQPTTAQGTQPTGQ